jgi:hypothetical protein
MPKHPAYQDPPNLQAPRTVHLGTWHPYRGQERGVVMTACGAATDPDQLFHTAAAVACGSCQRRLRQAALTWNAAAEAFPKMDRTTWEAWDKLGRRYVVTEAADRALGITTVTQEIYRDAGAPLLRRVDAHWSSEEARAACVRFNARPVV